MYDKAEKVVKNLSSIIFDLRAENESLYDTIEMYSARIDELRIEVSAKEEVANEYKERIDSAIACINEYKELVGMTGKLIYNLLNILEGNDDERKSN